ncbi:head-tail connector [Mycobacterium phage Weirdo19]|uniref:Head-tail connector n=1 Tax=Mycobacterium phage Weirdo19 TaxID=2601610 RepID=A0A6M2YSS2_9CAUD|nr:head closure Hc1 [Mycobacterium phage Weirdo19]QEA10777.1 head-tail connector [Mycobacterium phage Weirdo19]
MVSPVNLLTVLGPDTVELVIREPVDPPAIDVWGRPVMTERTVTKTGASWTVTSGTEEVAGSTIAVLNATGALPVDDDTENLQASAAVRHRGRLFELTTPGVRHDDGLGRPSHVRVFAMWAEDMSLGEQVIVVPAGQRRDGMVEPDGEPIPVIARAVTPGNASIKFGATGPSVAADYTVVLDLDVPVRDGDWLIVRGRECRALIERQESQWAERRELVVLAQYRGGGVT